MANDTRRTRSVQVRLTEQERDRLRAAANGRGLAVSDFIRLAIDEKIRREQTSGK